MKSAKLAKYVDVYPGQTLYRVTNGHLVKHTVEALHYPPAGLHRAGDEDDDDDTPIALFRDGDSIYPLAGCHLSASDAVRVACQKILSDMEAYQACINAHLAMFTTLREELRAINAPPVDTVPF